MLSHKNDCDSSQVYQKPIEIRLSDSSTSTGTNLDTNTSRLGLVGSKDSFESPLASSSPNKPSAKKTNNHVSPSDFLKVLVVNFQSVDPKKAELAVCIEIEQPDIIIGTETWLNDSVCNSSFLPSGYTAVRKDRPINPRTGVAHGGVMIAFKDNLVASHRCDLDTESEIVWLQVDLVGSKPLVIGPFYRPQTTGAAYLDKLRESINKLDIQKHRNIWIGGDFNLSDINWPDLCVIAGGKFSGLCQSLIDNVSDFGLEQLVLKPTRLENILDIFMTSNLSLVEKCTYIPGMSDHDAIPVITINTRAKKSKCKPHKIFLYKKADVEGLLKEIREMSSNFVKKNICETTENLWAEFKERVLLAVNNNVPSKMVSGNKLSPWINQSLKRKYKQKQRAFNSMRKNPTTKTEAAFKEIRSEIKKETRKRKRKFIQDTTLESSKQFYSYIKSMKTDNSGIQALRDGHRLVSDNKGKEPPGVVPEPPCLDHDIPSIPEIEIKEEGVQKLLKDLKVNKAAGNDGITPWILKTTAEVIAPALTIIFRSSLETGKLPKDWLQANISPIFKKGDKSHPLNYRPSTIRLFADDCIIYRTITGPQDANKLQEDLNKLTEWQNHWMMRYNEKKCYVMRISQSPYQFEYSLNGHQLQLTSCHSYLGVDISSDLKWNQLTYIFHVAAKANHTLGFVRRNLKPCSRRIKRLAYQ
ncbi:uncharacterized protein [Amphiura filiformis]|uniref:uncharacterized protein n=1 Tax=Amphiura filiformis TaxID=82378 RepID=UPI003B2181BB